jgi:hypothetical protein
MDGSRRRASDGGLVMSRTILISGAALLAIGFAAVIAPAAYGHDDHLHPVSARVTVQHVTQGCHELSIGARHGSALNLTVARKRAVGIFNTDGDSFRIVQVSGPKIATGGRLMTGLMNVLAFEHTGRYVFKVARVAKGSSPARAVGPDNTLRLRIRVL